MAPGEWRSAAPRRRSGARPRGRGPTGVAPPRPGRRSPGALARAREIELALDREGGLLAGVPVVERLLLERLLLVASRRPGRLLEDLVEMHAVARDVDRIRDLADRRREDGVVRLLVQLVPGDPAELAAGRPVGGVREVAGERGPVGAALRLCLELLRLVEVRREIHDLDDVPAEGAPHRLEDVARLDPRLEDPGAGRRVELPARHPAPIEVRQLATSRVFAGLVAVLPGDRVELRRGPPQVC